MGMKLFSDGPSDYTPATKTAPNPNPYRFKIIYKQPIGAEGVVVVAQYPDCTTHEGKKILVYRKADLDRALKQNKLDPHFLETTTSPFARFEPTALGLAMAVLVAERLT